MTDEWVQLCRREVGHRGAHASKQYTWPQEEPPHEHEWGPWELRPTIGDNVEASYCACGADKARQCGPEPEVPPTPRPPYAVAYAVQGGALYEVALPGDATACAEDGALIITHTKTPVLGIVRVTPMRTEGD